MSGSDQWHFGNWFCDLKTIGIYILSVLCALAVFILGGMLSKLIIPAVYFTKIDNEQRRLQRAGTYCLEHFNSDSLPSNVVPSPIATLGIPDTPAIPGIDESVIMISHSATDSFQLILADGSETIAEWCPTDRWRRPSNPNHSGLVRMRIVSEIAAYACMFGSVAILISGFFVGIRFRKKAHS